MDYEELVQLAAERHAEAYGLPPPPKPHFRLRIKQTQAGPQIPAADEPPDMTPVVMATLLPVLRHVAKTIGALRRRVEALEGNA